MSQTKMLMKGRAGAEGARASGDSTRDNWRTPKWLMDVLHAEFPMLWDATAHGPDEWAHGCEDGNTAPDALAAEWPTHRPVFCNPPFSQMADWSLGIALHLGATVTVCKLAPSAKWWKTLASQESSYTSGHGVGWTDSPKGRILRVPLLNDVMLWLLPCRVAYEPPPGIKKSSPRFDSCVVVRR